MSNGQLDVPGQLFAKSRIDLGLVLFYGYCFLLPFGGIQRMAYGASSVGLTSVLVPLVILVRLPETIHSLVKHKLLLLCLVLIGYTALITFSQRGVTSFEGQAYVQLFVLTIYVLFAAAVSTLGWNRVKLLVVSKCILAGLALCALMIVIDSLGLINIPRINDGLPGYYLGQFGHRSLMGVYLAPMVAFLLIMGEKEKSHPWFHIGVVLISCVYLFLLLLSMNRSGPAAILLSLGLYCLFGVRKERSIIGKVIASYFPPFALATIVLVMFFPERFILYFMRWISSPIIELLFPYVMTLTTGIGETKCFLGQCVGAHFTGAVYQADLLRWDLLVNAVSAMQTNVFGSGFVFDPHTFFFTDILYASGVLGILLSCLIFAVFLSMIMRGLGSVEAPHIWPVLCGLLAWILVGLAYNSVRLGLGWGFLGMVICLCGLAKRSEEGKMGNNEEREMDAYWGVIWNRRGIIIGGTLVAAATALVVSVSMPKSYEISRTLKIGRLPGNVGGGLVIGGKFIEAGEDVIGRLKDQRVLKTVLENIHPGGEAENIDGLVSIDTRSNPEVRFTVQARDARVGTEIADKLAQYIIKAHGQIFERAMQITKGYEAEMATKSGSLEVEIRSLKGMTEGMMKASEVDPAIIALLQASIGDRERNLAALRKEIMETRLSQLGSENTSVIVTENPPQHPVKPRVKLNVVLGGTLGLMGFTFLAFFLEYIDKARKRER